MTRFATFVLLLVGCDFALATDQIRCEKDQATAIAERVSPKIQKIQKELPTWLEKTGYEEAVALMQKLDEQVKSKQLVEAEKTADSLLELLGLNVPNAGTNAVPSGDEKSDTPATGSPEETTKRLTEKVERIEAVVQKWAASGRDPAEIFKTMQEQFQPLMQAGKIAEAEAVLDGVLKQLGLDVNPPTVAPANQPSAEERVLTRIHVIQKELNAWIRKTGRKEESDKLMLKLKEQLADLNFAESEKTADAILEMMGLSVAAVAEVERPAAATDTKHVADPLAAFVPQQLVFLAGDRIALTPKQRETLLIRARETQPRQKELKAALKRESAALNALTSQERVDEAAVLTQLDKFLDVEREAKLLLASEGVAISNLLTSEQLAKLRELSGHPGAVAKLEEEFKSRIRAKVERVTAGAQKWAQSGRDPSSVARAMEQKVRPLMDSGRAFEAETEIDRVLEMLNEDSK